MRSLLLPDAGASEHHALQLLRLRSGDNRHLGPRSEASVSGYRAGSMKTILELGGKQASLERDCPECEGTLHFYLGQLFGSSSTKVEELTGGHLDIGDRRDGKDGPCTLLEARLVAPGTDGEQVDTLTQSS